MMPSDNAVTLIKRFEGFRPGVYMDMVGKATVGYGHLIKAGEEFGILTEEDATNLLKTDLEKASACISKLCKVDLTQNQFDSLCSFVFNLGCMALQNSTLLRMLNQGDYVGAGNEFLKWDHAGGKEVQGLLNRRIAERELFNA